MNYADSVQETTTSTSTATIVLAGIVAGSATQSFADAFTVGDTNIPVRIVADSGAWINGLYTLTDAATLTRTAILSSSTGADVTMPAGSKDVFCTLPASQIAKFVPNDAALVTTTTDSAHLLIVESGTPKRITAQHFLDALGDTTGDLAAAGALAGSDIIAVSQDGGATQVRTTLTALAAIIASINGAPDAIAPAFASAQVTDASPTVIVITFTETLAAFTPATSAFTVSGGKTISGVSRSGATISLTVNSAYAYGDVITVAYTKPGTNMLQDAAGNETATFAAQSVTNNIAAPGATAPGAPTIGTATRGNGQASVTFTAPASDGGSAITGYTVTSSPGGFTGTGAASPIVVTGLTNGTAYTFTVTATNAIGTSAASAASSAVTPATTPGAPTIGTATGGDTTASVTFTAPASNGGSAITGYTVTSSPGGLTGTGATSPISVTGLTNGTAYTFTVTATNAVGTGSASAASNSVTPAAVGAPAYLFSPVALDFPGSADTTITDGGNSGASPRIYIKTAGGVTPANVKFAWSKSTVTAPCAYADATNAAGGANSFLPCSRTGGWTQGGGTGQSYYGLYGADLYAWGTAGTYYLWAITDDGFAAPYSQGGTPVGWTLT